MPCHQVFSMLMFGLPWDVHGSLHSATQTIAVGMVCLRMHARTRTRAHAQKLKLSVGRLGHELLDVHQQCVSASILLSVPQWVLVESKTVPRFLYHA